MSKHHEIVGIVRKPLLYTFALSVLILLTASRCGAEVSPVTPNDPLFREQWGLKRILAPEAWNIEKGNSSIIVAIVDTGVDYSHPDLKANMWTAPDATHGWDFAENDSDPMDADGHGTWVAGVVGAVANNGIGVCGVVWNVKIMAVRVRVFMGSLEEAEYPKVAQGIRYATDNGARVINLSLGGFSVPPEVLKEAVDYAYSKGVLLVGSAGNQNTDRPRYPAAYENVMAIAGTDRDDEKAGFSNFGERIDVCAPGYATTTALHGNYTSMLGTSFSAPYVSGLAALLFSHYPRLTNAQVRQIIKATADNIDSLNPNYRGKLGAGRINCYKALTEQVNVSIVTTITESGTTYFTTITTAIPEFSDAGMVLAFTLTSALVMGRRRNKNRLR